MDMFEIAAFYDSEAERYWETRNTPAFRHVMARERKLMRLLPEPVLDIGSGAGGVLRGSGKEFVAVDISKAMLSMNPSTRRVVANGLSLPFRDSSFPSAACLLLTPNVIGRGVFQEIRRVLKLGGLALMSFEVSERAFSKKAGGIGVEVFERGIVPDGFAVERREKLFKWMKPSWRYKGRGIKTDVLMAMDYLPLSTGKWHAEVVLLRKS